MRDLPGGTVTLLFTGIEGATHLLQHLSERYPFVLIEHRQLLRAACRRWNGHEVDTQEYASLVAFARATDAVSAAVDAQRALASHPLSEVRAVRVRMGLHTGEPALTSEGYAGLDVHRAACVMSAGHGGQVLLSQATNTLVEQDLRDGVSLQDLGEHRLKDLGRPQHLFQLVIADLPADFPLLKTLDAHPNNLSIQPTPFIGREKEVATVRDLLGRENVRLLTLTGPGGTGKTRLSLQVAAELSDRFVDGVFFVNLAPIREPEFVIPAIAQALEVKETAEQSLLELLKASLREKQILLILDNFEQIVSAVEHVAALLTACLRLKIVVTSREVLHVRAEHEFAVPPLALPDPKRLPDPIVLSQYEAVALFIERAQAARPDFQVTNANTRAVAEICVCLDGLPLAIELAAARSKLLPPQALLARLERRLAVLTSAARDVPARHQTLRNTIAWSYDLLPAEEQALFRRLSVFVGGFTLEALEAICAAPGDGDGAASILDEFASLIDKSLLQQTEQEGAMPRFVTLETIREYGLECLQRQGELQAARLAHARYTLALAEQAEPELNGPNQVAWVERFEQEHDNLRTALEWALEEVTDEQVRERREVALRLSAALWEFWRINGHYGEGRTFLERALAQSKGQRVSLRAKVLRAAANLAIWHGDHARAEMLAEQCLALDRELGDTRGIANCLFLLGGINWRRGKTAEAITLYEEVVMLKRQVGEPWEVGQALSYLADLVVIHGEYPRGQALFEEALALITKVGDQHWRAHASSFAAWVVLSEGESARASELAQESLALFREMDARWDIALALQVLGRVETQRGDLRAARGHYEESLALSRELGEQFIFSLSLEGLAGVLATQGKLRWAAQLWGAAEGLREAIAISLPPVDRPRYEQAVSVARAQLGESVFATAWQEGRTMTPEQALAARGGSKTISAESPATPQAKSPPTYPAGLTAREVEVLRLVTQGFTNTQVAAQLVVSPRTVNFHLTSIYSKIGVSSRNAATRYAIEQHLI